MNPEYVSFSLREGSVARAPGAEADGSTRDELLPGEIGEGVDSALAIATRLGLRGLRPGCGKTRELWETLATVAARDLGTARVIEPHLDALAILRQSGVRLPDALSPAANLTWGVFAAERGERLLAEELAGEWRLVGTKAWCSLAGTVDAALVSAWPDSEHRRLFAVLLRQPGVRVEPDAWHARGLAEIPSGPVTFLSVPAIPVGPPDWYLDRPGFSWGGIGVAACWYGGAVGMARTLFAAAKNGEPDPFLSMHVGAVDVLLGNARRSLLEAAEAVDGGGASGAEGRLLAKRVRSTVADSCEQVISRAAHALGPGPLATDAAHSKRVADLELYLRQHHAERDQASLGKELLGSGASPW